MQPSSQLKLIVLGLIILFTGFIIFGSFHIINPGVRGVMVTLGKVNPVALTEGVTFKPILISTIREISIRQQTEGTVAECYSSDLQQLDIDLKVLYRIPENQVVTNFQKFAGDPFQTLIAPRVNESIKEVTAMQSAEQIVKRREEVKMKALEAARQKIGEVVIIEDLVISNISLSKELELAIEQKMIQEQEAAKAKYIQQKAEIEASTAIIKARGEAESIRIRGNALSSNPNLVQLMIVEKWDGKSPMVVGGNGNFILPIPRAEDR